MASGVVMAGHVSTHSRPKAAGPDSRLSVLPTSCFNSQPPEGGWTLSVNKTACIACFNSQPPEGGWQRHFLRLLLQIRVSTHSRPKAAGIYFKRCV